MLFEWSAILGYPVSQRDSLHISSQQVEKEKARVPQRVEILWPCKGEINQQALENNFNNSAVRLVRRSHSRSWIRGK
jgi:hypothetical protein